MGFLQDLERVESVQSWDVTCCLAGIWGGGKPEKKSGNGTQLKEPKLQASVRANVSTPCSVPWGLLSWGAQLPPSLSQMTLSLRGSWLQSKHR